VVCNLPYLIRFDSLEHVDPAISELVSIRPVLAINVDDACGDCVGHAGRLNRSHKSGSRSRNRRAE
jgi:hypothetical protein